MVRLGDVSRRYDAVVVGGGPAGATVGGLLASRGRRVLVVERQAFPRFQIGESLLPLSCEIFEKLGVMSELCERCTLKFGATFVDADTGRKARYRFAEAFDSRYPHAFQVRRASFDTLLLERARALGAEVRQPCRVEEIRFEGDRAVGVRLEGGDIVDAPVVVDATGRGALLATRFARRQRIPHLDQTAIYAHYEGVERLPGEAAGDVTVVMFDQGWFWIIPFLDGETSVGLVATRQFMATRGRDDLATFWERSLRDVPFMVEAMRDARPRGELRTAADFSYRVDPIVGDGWLCVGDALGFVDPLFSSGVHLAMRSGDAAAAAIDAALTAGDLSQAAFAAYGEKVRYASGLFMGVVQAAYDGEFRQMLFAEPQRPALRKVITSILSGDVMHDDPPAWVRFVSERFQPTL